MPLPFDLSPDALFRKAISAFTESNAETSETPEYIELKTRRYEGNMRDIYELALQLPPRWFGWRIISREKNLGGISAFKCEIFSSVLGGNRLELSIWLQEETDLDGITKTIVNAKCNSQAPTKGDLGESRRNIAFFLYSLDEAVSERLSRAFSTPTSASTSAASTINSSQNPTQNERVTDSSSAPTVNTPPIQRPRVSIKQGAPQRISIKQSASEK